MRGPLGNEIGPVVREPTLAGPGPEMVWLAGIVPASAPDIPAIKSSGPEPTGTSFGGHSVHKRADKDVSGMNAALDTATYPLRRPLAASGCPGSGRITTRGCADGYLGPSKAACWQDRASLMMIASPSHLLPGDVHRRHVYL